MKNLRVKFSRFRLIRKIILMVDNCNMDEHLESCWRLVYYQVSGEPRIAPVVVDQTFTLGSVDLCASLFIDHHRIILFFACLIFAVDLDREITLNSENFPDLRYVWSFLLGEYWFIF